MIKIHKDKTIKIRWFINRKGGYTEEFRDSSLYVWLCGAKNRILLTVDIAQPLVFDIPEGLAAGDYSLCAIWVKKNFATFVRNGKGTDNALNKARIDGVFSLVDDTDGQSDEVLDKDSVTLNCSSFSEVFGYDGLDAYQLAVLRGETADEDSWLNAYIDKMSTIETAVANCETATANAEDAERERATAELERAAAEQERVAAETLRAEAEDGRKVAENARVAAETLRAAAEEDREAAESKRAADFEVNASNTIAATNAANTATQNANNAAEACNNATLAIQQSVIYFNSIELDTTTGILSLVYDDSQITPTADSGIAQNGIVTVSYSY